MTQTTADRDALERVLRANRRTEEGADGFVVAREDVAVDKAEADDRGRWRLRLPESC